MIEEFERHLRGTKSLRKHCNILFVCCAALGNGMSRHQRN